MKPFVQGESFYNLIARAIPDFAESEYPLFLEFVSAFLRYLEQARTFEDRTVYPEYGTSPNSVIQVTTTVGGPLYETRKLLEYRDTDSSLAEFKTHFLSMFGKNFPTYHYVSTDQFVQSLRQFYQAKGTVESFQWLFRVLFNEDADVYFPREDVLRASDGTWVAPLSIKVTAPTDSHTNRDVVTYYSGQRIQTATGSAQVESVVERSYNQNLVVNDLRLKFDSVLGYFLSGQDLFNIDSDEVVHTTILPVITDIIVNSGGDNYAVDDVVTFSEGPGGGGGYGAFGVVSVVSNTAISGVIVVDGGAGYLVGEPVTFVSASGHGATAFVSNVVFGNLLLEDESGYFLGEDNLTTVQLEDQNMLLLELVIDPFVNATATVLIDDPDYGLSTGVVSMEGIVIDSEVSYALAALDTKPFMHPWCFTNQAETIAELANAMANVAFTSNTFFSAGASVFVLDSATDAVTTVADANVVATIITAPVAEGGTVGTLYLKDFTGINLFSTGMILKESGNGTLQVGTITTNGSANVIGTNTAFTTMCRANGHLRFDDGTHAVIRTVVNNTFLVTFASVGVTLVANGYAIIPTANVTAIVAQTQRYYGKIKTVTMLTNGVNYAYPPAVFVDSLSARAQEYFYLDPNPFPPVDTFSANNATVAAAEQINVFDVATLQLATGQVIQKVKLLDSGANYQDANAIVATALHTAPATGANADLIVVTGALTQNPGHYTTSRGFLSADKFLQDTSFYNDYTYVIRVAESFDRYRDILLRLVHPVGFHVLGQVVDLRNAELVVPEAEMILLERPPLPTDLLISDPLWGNGVSMPQDVDSLEDYYDGTVT